MWQVWMCTHRTCYLPIPADSISCILFFCGRSLIFSVSPQKILFSCSTQGVTNDTEVHSSTTTRNDRLPSGDRFLFFLPSHHSPVIQEEGADGGYKHTHIQKMKIVIIIIKRRRPRNLFVSFVVITTHNRFCGHRYEGNVIDLIGACVFIIYVQMSKAWKEIKSF